MTYESFYFKIGNKTINSITSAFILVDIKAGLRSNSGLLEVNVTQRAAKINVLDGYAYPELSLSNVYSRLSVAQPAVACS